MQEKKENSQRLNIFLIWLLCLKVSCQCIENLIILIFVKKKRLHETIESAQTSIKEVVDTDNLTFECKIYKVMDTAQDMEDILKLQKVIEEHPDAGNQAEAIKKARIGYINLKARTYELKNCYRDLLRMRKF